VVVAYWDSLACKVTQTYAIHEMLNQENHTIPTAAEDTLLAKVLLEVARIESRAADATTSSRRRFASDELLTSLDRPDRSAAGWSLRPVGVPGSVFAGETLVLAASIAK
jgi:hypothetical protein